MNIFDQLFSTIKRFEVIIKIFLGGVTLLFLLSGCERSGEQPEEVVSSVETEEVAENQEKEPEPQIKLIPKPNKQHFILINEGGLHAVNLVLTKEGAEKFYSLAEGGCISVSELLLPNLYVSFKKSFFSINWDLACGKTKEACKSGVYVIQKVRGSGSFRRGSIIDIIPDNCELIE